MGVKCLAQKHNMVPWSGLRPGPLDLDCVVPEKKYPHPPHGRSLEILKGGGGLNSQTFKGKFQGVGGFK